MEHLSYLLIFLFSIHVHILLQFQYILLIFSCASETSEMFTLFINRSALPEEGTLFLLRIVSKILN